MLQVERNSLQATWKRSKLLLCQFHVLLAMWRWLYLTDHDVLKDDKPKLLFAFRAVLYSETKKKKAYKLNLAKLK